MKALTTATLRLLQNGPVGCPKCHRGRRGGPEASCCEDCAYRCTLSAERVTLSIIAGMVNSGWFEEDAYLHLCDPANVGGRFLQALHSRNAGRARAWLHRQYAETQSWVIENPAYDPMEDRYLLTRLQEAVSRNLGISSGQAGVTERAVLRFLIGLGLRKSSVIVRAGHRKISENTCASLATVHRTVGRLKKAGWVEVYEAAHGYRENSYRLQFPAAGNLITEVPLSTGGKDTPVPKLPVAVHRLFAAQGLGRGAQETFALLPLRMRPVGRLVGVTVDRTAPAWVKNTAPGDPLRMPKAPRGPAQTAEQIARRCGKSVETVRRHLRRLEQARMAFRVNGRWYRFHFGATALAEYLQVPDTPSLLHGRYARDLDNYFEFLASPKGQAIHKIRITRHETRGLVVYLDPRSGEVLHSRTIAQPSSEKEAG